MPSLKEKSAMEEIVLRVAAKSQVTVEQADRVATRFARSIEPPRTVTALSVGEKFENEAWRIHRNSMAIRVTDLTNAGKRGKKVETLSLYKKFPNAKTPLESIAMEFVMNAKRKASFAKMKEVAEQALEVLDDVGMQILVERGVDVAPGDFKPIMIEGEHVLVEAGFDDFSVKDLDDKNNEKTCTPRAEGSKKDIPVFYRWVQDNKKKILRMTYSDVITEMGKLQIEYHNYCAYD